MAAKTRLRSDQKTASSNGRPDRAILSTPDTIERRPWGYFSVYLQGKVPTTSWEANFIRELRSTYHPEGELLAHEPGEAITVKIIHVYAKSRLSLQYHHHRTEEWYCLSGHAYAILNRNGRLEEVPLEKDSRVVVPQMMVHRLGCKEESAEILEVSKGAFDEADIVRLEDDYRIVNG
jgi:mannose-6-phosphate isomerase